MSRLLALTVIAIVSVSAPVVASDEQDCFQNKEPQLRIKGCSQIIQRDPNNATAYHNRAVAYGLTGDIDHAIADYSKTIEIRPDNAAAYENRGRAYASKGDYTHALADVTKASELVAKAATGSIALKPKPPKTASIAPKTATIPAKAIAAAPAAKAMPQASKNVAKKASQEDWPAWASILNKSAD